MDFEQQMLVILLCGIASLITRFVPFLIFRPGQEIPEKIRYLGSVLPLAIFAMLVIYCIKDIDFVGDTFGIPEVAAMMTIVIVHLHWRKMLLSVICGMICYFLLYVALPMVI